MNVAYKCRCMDSEATIAVPDRKPDQDIVNWVEITVAGGMGEDHRRRSPHCQADKVEYAKFEVDPAGGPLGTITRQ